MSIFRRSVFRPDRRADALRARQIFGFGQFFRHLRRLVFRRFGRRIPGLFAALLPAGFVLRSLDVDVSGNDAVFVAESIEFCRAAEAVDDVDDLLSVGQAVQPVFLAARDRVRGALR